MYSGQKKKVNGPKVQNIFSLLRGKNIVLSSEFSSISSGQNTL